MGGHKGRHRPRRELSDTPKTTHLGLALGLSVCFWAQVHTGKRTQVDQDHRLPTQAISPPISARPPQMINLMEISHYFKVRSASSYLTLSSLTNGLPLVLTPRPWRWPARLLLAIFPWDRSTSIPTHLIPEPFGKKPGWGDDGPPDGHLFVNPSCVVLEEQQKMKG